MFHVRVEVPGWNAVMQDRSKSGAALCFVDRTALAVAVCNAVAEQLQLGRVEAGCLNFLVAF